MNPSHERYLFVLGGISGIVGTMCYIAAATVPSGQRLTYVLAMTWPILSVIFVFSLYRFIAGNRQGTANQLAFIFASLGLTMVATMISIQLGVRTGIEQYIAHSPEHEEILKLLHRSIRLVDMGLDVAWDLFIGTSLMFLCVALVRHDRFGSLWGFPLVYLVFC